MIVLKFNFSVSDASDSVLVYLDPKSAKEPGTPNASLTGINATLGAIGGFTEYGGSGQGPVFDELRIADTFGDAVPKFPLPGDTNNDDLVDLVDYQNILAHLNFERSDCAQHARTTSRRDRRRQGDDRRLSALEG